MSSDERDVARRRRKRQAARDVVIPPVANPVRLAHCRDDLAAFCRAYLPDIFTRPFSCVHREIIADLQDVILHGSKSTIIDARGGGKTSLTIAAILWGLLYGHRRYLVIVTDTHRNAVSRFKTVRTLLETSARLAADFPHPTACVRALERVYNRAGQQTVKGEPTHISLGGGMELQMVLPTVAGSPSSGSVVAIGTMESAIRGLQHTTAGGEMLRPDFVLLDDPQDRPTANNPIQVDKREEVILGDVLGLAGPGQSLACVFLGTCIVKGDLTDRFGDRDRHPDWRGRTYKIMERMPGEGLPDAEAAAVQRRWDRYWDIREKSLKRLGHDRLAASYYLVHRREMDMGARPSWAHRYNPKREYSAVQHAQNLRQDMGDDAFFAEYQNQPPEPVDQPLLVLDAYTVEKSDSGLPHQQIPDNALSLVLGIDVGRYAIYWTAAAVAAQRVVSIVDYGAVPVDSPQGVIEASDTQMRQAVRAAILTALRTLRDQIAADPYRMASGEEVPLDLALIDARWETPAVLEFCSESGAAWQPAMGHGTARNQVAWRPPQKAVVAPDGNLYYVPGERVMTFHCHTDAYKLQVHEGFLLPGAAPGSIRLWPEQHRKQHHTFARHLTAEMQREKLPGVYVWETVRGRAANHYLDSVCYALACVTLMELTVADLNIAAERSTAVAVQPGWTDAPDRDPEPVAAAHAGDWLDTDGDWL